MLSKILSAFPTSNPSRRWNSFTCQFTHCKRKIRSFLCMRWININRWKLDRIQILPPRQVNSCTEGAPASQRTQYMNMELTWWCHQRNGMASNLLPSSFAAENHQDSLFKGHTLLCKSRQKWTEPKFASWWAHDVLCRKITESEYDELCHLHSQRVIIWEDQRPDWDVFRFSTLMSYWQWCPYQGCKFY